MAKVQLQNQTFDIPEEMVALNPTIITEKGEAEAKRVRDSELKRWLSRVTPLATNAELTWEEKELPGGAKDVTVKATPKLGTKGAETVTAVLIRRLTALPQHIHPLILLAQELQSLQQSGAFSGPGALERLQAFQPLIERTVARFPSDGNDSFQISMIMSHLRTLRPTPTPWIPAGF